MSGSVSESGAGLRLWTRKGKGKVKGRERGREMIFPYLNEWIWGIYGMGCRACDAFFLEIAGVRGKTLLKRTTAEPVIVHLARIAFDIVILRRSLDDFEILARDHDIGGVGAAGPFLAIGAMAEGGDHGLTRVFVLDGGAQAGAFGHGERT